MDANAPGRFDADLVNAVSHRIAEFAKAPNLDGAMQEFEFLRRLIARATSPIQLDDDLFEVLLRSLADDDARRGPVVSLRESNRDLIATDLAFGDFAVRPYGEGFPRLDSAISERLVRLMRPEVSWPVELLYQAEWQALTGARAAAVLHRIYSALDSDPLFAIVKERGVVAVRSHKPDFYEDVEVVELLLDEGFEQKTPGYSMVVLLSARGAIYLNGLANRIHALNATDVLRLTSPEQVKGYLKFFCGTVHGEATGGSFTIIESADQLQERLPVIDRNVIDTLWSTCAPLNASQPNESQLLWKCRATVAYSNAIFVADFEIKSAQGTVEMRDDNPLAANLPARYSLFDRRALRQLAP